MSYLDKILNPEDIATPDTLELECGLDAIDTSIDMLEATVEYHDALSELNHVDTIENSLVIIGVESSDIRFEEAESAKISIFKRILESIKKFFRKIRDIWLKFCNMIKDKMMKYDINWFNKHTQIIENALNADVKLSDVIIHEYSVESPLAEIGNDVEIMHAALSILLDESTRLLSLFNSNFFITKDTFTDMEYKIDIAYKSMCERIGIDQPKDKFEDKFIIDAMYKKYFGYSNQMNKLKLSPLTMLSKFDAVKKYFTIDNYRKFIDFFNKTSKVAYSNIGIIDMAESKINDNYDPKSEKAFDANQHSRFSDSKRFKDYTERMKAIISNCKNSVTMSNAIGTSMLKIYQLIRTDLIICAKSVVKDKG